MQFNIANKQGLVGDIDFWLGTTNSSYPIEDKTRNINNRYDEAVDLIMAADGNFQFDDSNHPDLPVGKTNLVSGQDNYEIAASSFLDILRVELTQSNGTSIFLDPIDYSDLRGTAMTEFRKTNGIPRYYDKVGNSLVLYPTPNYSYANGLTVYFRRNVILFTTTSTTEEPGFARQFHRLLSIGASIDYAVAKGLEKKQRPLMKEWEKMAKNMQLFYSSRSKDQKVRLKLLKSNEYQDYLDTPDMSVDWSS